MSEWILKRRSADYATLSKELNIDPLIIRILLNRGITKKEEMYDFLYGTRENLIDYKLLPGIKEASELLKDKIKSKAKIRVVGDYDVDGVCATAILVKGLKSLGANVDHYIPKRFADGYGLNVSIIENAKKDNVDTILTCDNGIAATNQISLAKSYGMTVIVTDHHEIPYEQSDGGRVLKLPEADVIVDPKLNCDTYPFAEICGAYVAFKLMESMLDDKELIDELLQYAALATVSDVMGLVSENRILVKTGIDLVNEKPATGLKALIDINELKEVTAFHFGFVLGPSINAAGRLKDAEIAYELLMMNDYNEALEKAKELKSLNDERKDITEKCTNQAIELIDSTELINDHVIVAAVDNCHEGVIGIVAGRLKERYHRPVFVVTDAEGVYKGSARSIEEYNIYEEMSKVSELFIKFGGHQGAAGFSIEIDNLEKLRKALNDNCTLTEKDLVEKLFIDADMPFSYCSEGLMDQIKMLEPFGSCNESPVFARNDVTIISCKLFGQEGKVGKYKITDAVGRKYELTLFRRNGELREYLEGKYGKSETDRLYNGESVSFPMSIAYYPNWNEYNGIRTIQFVVVDYK